MYQINLNSPQAVHFIGIGGISMSGLAEILIHNGFKVSGSDMNGSKTTAHLEDIGVYVTPFHHASNINSNHDLIVYTAAVKADNCEYQEALRLNIPLIDRAELLGQIMRNYKTSIGISGTHGKTTTTSMISEILLNAECDPTISVGGMLDAIGGNIRVGNSEFFVTEACEYANSFLKFKPLIEIILNIDEDHLDFFKDLKEIRSSFEKYMHNVPETGTVIINSDIENYLELTQDLKCSVITFGADPTRSDWSARNISFDHQGCSTFDLLYRNEFKDTLKINATGIHNVYNSLSAIAAAIILDIPFNSLKETLSKFGPPKRRFEFKGDLMGVKIFDDYAHHPTEIAATLLAAKKLQCNKLWVVFQPHTYTRTKSFLKEFAKSLALADHIILTDIYAAREKDLGEIHSLNLLEELKLQNENCYYFSSFDDIEICILSNCVAGDLLITIGAGNVYILGEDLLRG